MLVDDFLQNSEVLAALQRAWFESEPGLAGGHEEGGFVLRRIDGTLRVVRWLRGLSNQIEVPDHPGCRLEGEDIAATFHTHPNTGSDYTQRPSRNDIRAVRDDPELKGQYYFGEFVVSEAELFLVTPLGDVQSLGPTTQWLRTPPTESQPT